MTAPVPNGPELPPDQPTWRQWPQPQQGEVQGRYLDPVRAKALHEAVNVFPYLPESVSDDPVGEILAIAERFEGYLGLTARGAHD